MNPSVPTLLAFAIVPPLLAGLLAYVTPLHVVRDRKSRTGEGWAR